jgi:hypothetical protein
MSMLDLIHAGICIGGMEGPAGPANAVPLSETVGIAGPLFIVVTPTLTVPVLNQ